MIYDVVVIGAGAAGAAAAESLSRRGLHVLVCEAGEKVGGRLADVDLGGLNVDVGAQFVTNFYYTSLSLLERVGLRGGLHKIRPSMSAAQDGQVVKLQSASSILLGRSLPWRAIPATVGEIFRAMCHWPELEPTAVWKAASLDSTSLDAALKSKSGRAYLNSLVAPAINHFLYWDAASTTRAFSPILVKAAAILRGVFVLDGGFSRLVESSLANVEVRCNSMVNGVRLEAGLYRCILAGGTESSIDARAVVIATDAITARNLWDSFPADLSSFMRDVQYSSTVVVTSRVRRRIPAPAYGIMNRSASAVDIAAVTVLSRRGWPSVAPGEDVLQVFLDHSMAERVMELSDEELVRSVDVSVQREFGSDYSLSSGSMCLNVQRWRGALPRFTPGYLHRLASVQPLIRRRSSIVVAGDYLSGPFIEGAVESGRIAADSVAAFFGADHGKVENE